MRKKKIIAVLYPGSVSLDVAGPLEAFYYATLISKEETGLDNCGYEIELVAAKAGPVESMSGVRLFAERSTKTVKEPCDILLVPGMKPNETRYEDDGLLQWLNDQAARSTRVVSVCSGAIVLAHAGLLDGHRVTTHWNSGKKLRENFDNIDVDDSKIYCKSGKIYSSAGVTAGIDLALSIIQEDFGRSLALKIAKRMVVFLQRAGDQSQFSELLSSQGKSKRFTDLLDWIEENLSLNITTSLLADRCAMSERNFSRSFKADLNYSPMQYVTRRRLEWARLLLEEDNQALDAIAKTSGFVSTARFSASFKEAFHITPIQYKKRFNARG